MKIFKKLESMTDSSNKFAVIAILIWSAQLLNSRAYYVPYLLISIAAVISCIFNNHSPNNLLKNNNNHLPKLLISVFSSIFSLMITLSNYDLWSLSKFHSEIIYHILFFICGYIVFKNILNALLKKLPFFLWFPTNKTLSPSKAFIICFLSITIINCSALFLGFYPGILTPDSISQITQILSGNYSNHHPYYHTQIIKLFFMIGMLLFNNINAAVATYIVFQILFMSICFSLTISTMAHLKISNKILLLMSLFYALMPYHIMYSITMWKDIMFGGFVLLFITFIFRIFQNIGNKTVNYIFLFISSLGFCLFRSNGFFAFVMLTIFLFLLFKMEQRKMLFIFIAAIFLSTFMKYPILNYLNVKQPDTIEALSIPAQQIARVISENKPLTSDEKQLLEKVINVNEIPQKYKPYISDNIKNLVRKKGNQHLFKENKFEYLKLYVQLGIKYPLSYARGWIDETKGYWNAGYEYWRWSTGIHENNLEIKPEPLSQRANKYFNRYLSLFTRIQLLRIFLCIGLFVWINLLMLFINMYRKDKIGILISLPTIMIVLSLLIATPVFSEFRYLYAIFCALPMIITISLRNLSQELSEGNSNV